MGRLIPLALVLLLCGGCRLVFERDKQGTPEPIQQARGLEAGKDTVATTLAKLGSPDLILRVGDRTRVYYTYWDKKYTRLQVDLIVRAFSATLFIWTFGGELFEMARLDFDSDGVLREPMIAEIQVGSEGYYAAANNMLLTFFEDQERSLYVEDEPDDDD